MRYFLVDYENVNWAGLYGISFLTEDDTVLIFYSDHADTVNFTTLDYIMRSKALIKRHRITKFGNNALDFQLSTYVGYLLGTHTEGEVYIISKDQGYLSVLDFCRERLVNTGVKVEMYSSINGLLLKERSRNRNIPAGAAPDFLPEVDIKKPELEPLNETQLPDLPAEPAFKTTYTSAAVAAAKASVNAEQKHPEVVVKIVGKKQEQETVVNDEKPQLRLQIKAEDLVEKIASKSAPSRPVVAPAPAAAPVADVKIMTDDLTESISPKSSAPSAVKRETPVAEAKPQVKIEQAPAAEVKNEAPVEDKPEKPARGRRPRKQNTEKREKSEKTEKTEQKSAEAKSEKPAEVKTEKPAQAPPEADKTENPAEEKTRKPREKKPRTPKKAAETASFDTPATIDYLKLRVAVAVSKIESLVDADEVERDEICEKITGFILNAENKQAFYLSFTKTFGQKQGVEYFNALKKDFTLLKAIADAIKKENK